MRQPSVTLVHPAPRTLGGSFMTPRWLFVIAGATPKHLVSDIRVVDETIIRFDPCQIQQGDIVAISITTHNVLAGYRVLAEAKKRGAIVVMGGIHATLFPDEPLKHGANAVVTGDGDLVWATVVEDICSGRLKPRYDGGQVEGEYMQPADWSYLNPDVYMLPSVQTIKGCPKACSFCSVHMTDKRKVRGRLADKVIEEVLYLYSLGYRAILLADDNADPAPLPLIEAEKDPRRQEELRRIRDGRLAFMREYGRRVPKDMIAFTQMTHEAAGDPEYLKAMYEELNIRGALVGIESIDLPGLKSIRKTWNLTAEKMIEAIQIIQRQGIFLLGSMIVGLPTDTPETLAVMRLFAKKSEMSMAQFVIYAALPGTPDWYAMLHGRHPMRLVDREYWLRGHGSTVYEHPTMDAKTLTKQGRLSWRSFYAPTEILRRARRYNWPWNWKAGTWYGLVSFAFYAQNARSSQGISADAMRIGKASLQARLGMKIALMFYKKTFRKRATA